MFFNILGFQVLIFLASGWTMMIFTLLPKVLMTSNNCRMMRACWFQSIDHFENIMTDSQQDSFWWKVHLLFSTILTIFLPISLITVCNLRILTIANYQRHKIANAIFEATLSAQVAITHQKNPYAMPFFYQFSPNALEVRRKSKKATFVVFELIIIVVVLYLPYYIFMIWLTFYLNEQNTKFWKNEQRLDYLNMAIFTVQYIILLSPTINACLYGLNNKTIKENLKNIWRKKKTKIELLHEIQNRTPSTSGSRRPSLTDNLNIPQLAPSNLLHLQQKPILNRQLSDFFFGTSSSLTCHNISDDLTLFHTNKMHRTPSDSLFLNSHDWPHEHYHLSPIKNSQNFRMTPSISKNLLNNFKKLLVSSKNDLRNDIAKSGEIGFPQILVTKHSDTIIYQQQINRNNSGNQQVDLVDNYEKEPFLTQTLSLNDFTMSLPINSKKFMTL